MKNQAMGVNEMGTISKIQQWLQNSGGVTL